jgi:hypothetical protein
MREVDSRAWRGRAAGALGVGVYARRHLPRRSARRRVSRRVLFTPLPAGPVPSTCGTHPTDKYEPRQSRNSVFSMAISLMPLRACEMLHGRPLPKHRVCESRSGEEDDDSLKLRRAPLRRRKCAAFRTGPPVLCLFLPVREALVVSRHFVFCDVSVFPTRFVVTRPSHLSIHPVR